MVKSRQSKYTPIVNRTLRSTGKLTDKGFRALAKQNASVADDASRNVSMMELQQKMNSLNASSALFDRQSNRLSKLRQTLDMYDKPPVMVQIVSLTSLALGWVIDHCLYVLHLIWGFIASILSTIFGAIFRAVFIVLINAIFFYAIYLFLTAKS